MAEQDPAYTADIKTCDLELSDVEVGILGMCGLTLDDTIAAAEAIGRKDCQREAEQCELRMNLVRRPGSIAVCASCTNCPNPELAFEMPREIKNFAQDRIDLVRATPPPGVFSSLDLTKQIEFNDKSAEQASPETLELERASLPSHWKSILYYSETERGKWHGEPGSQMLIEELDLGVRPYNILKRFGVQTIFDLVTRTEAEISEFQNMGRKSLDEVIEKLAGLGIRLRTEEEKKQADLSL